MPLRTYRLSLLPPTFWRASTSSSRACAPRGARSTTSVWATPTAPARRRLVDRLHGRAGADPGFQRYMPSQGSARAAAGDLRLVPAPLRRDASIPRREAVVTIGSKEGIAHLLLALVGPGDCVLAPDPGLSHPPARGWCIAGGEAGAGGRRPRTRPLPRDRGGAGPFAPAAQGADRQLPAQPHHRHRRSRLLRAGGALARAQKLWVISDLAYADLCFDDRPAPSIFQVPGGARGGGRVLHGLEELFHAGLAGRLLRGQPRAGGRADHHQGLHGLRHLRARPSWRRPPRSPPATPTWPRTAPLYRHRAEVLVRGAARRRAGR